jgi:DNA-binding response OmpR family regulator
LKEAGADDFMQKPFSVDQLMQRSYQLLQMDYSGSY